MKLRKLTLLVVVSLVPFGVLLISCGDDNGAEPAKPLVPVLTTTSISTITRSTAESGGNITSDNGHAVTARGVCWGTTANPTLNDSTTSDGYDIGNFSSSLTGLAYNTKYYVRAYAVNAEGTGYGNTVSFTTLDSAYTVTDMDGNVYQALSIGTQVWMIENLKVHQYRNGEVIPRTSDNGSWNWNYHF